MKLGKVVNSRRFSAVLFWIFQLVIIPRISQLSITFGWWIFFYLLSADNGKASLCFPPTLTHDPTATKRSLAARTSFIHFQLFACFSGVLSNLILLDKLSARYLVSTSGHDFNFFLFPLAQLNESYGKLLSKCQMCKFIVALKTRQWPNCATNQLITPHASHQIW